MIKGNRIIVMKFGGTTSGSTAKDHRIKDARLLIERYLEEGYFVVPVFSAMRRPSDAIAMTDTLLKSRDIIGHSSNSFKENLRQFKDLLFKPHLDLMRDLELVPEELYKEALTPNVKAFTEGKDRSLLESVRQQVNTLVRKASAYYDAPYSPAGMDALVVGGERLAATIIAGYLAEKWKQTRFPFAAGAEMATAKEIGILTNGNFMNADILQGQKYELIVKGNINRYRKHKIIPVVTGFDGVYKATTVEIERSKDVSSSIKNTDELFPVISELLTDALQQSELKDRTFGRITINCFLKTKEKQPAERQWKQAHLSWEIHFKGAIGNKGEILEEIKCKLPPLPDSISSSDIKRVAIQLSDIQHRVGFVTTLGRGGSDLTATYIAKAVRAEAVFLLKDTDGVLTANPKIVPNAYAITHLPYELAVKAGNIQDKAVRPAVEGNIPIEIFNPKNPEIRTTVGPYPIENRPYLIPNATQTRFLRLEYIDDSNPAELIEDILKQINSMHGIELLEFQYDSNYAMLLVKESHNVEHLERYILRKPDLFLRSEPAYYLQIVGRMDNKHIDSLTGIITPLAPLLFPVARPASSKLTFALPATIDVSEVIRQIHTNLFTSEPTSSS